MTYSQGHPIRLVGGRLALDFVNTADWSPDAHVLHEKIAAPADLRVWLTALDLGDLELGDDLAGLLSFRLALRHLFLGAGDPGLLNAARGVAIPPDAAPAALAAGQDLKSLLAVSALAILTDRRERDRIRLCPGDRCGWLFIDETRNARRKWCSMETCGNRAKATRHYARTKEARG